MTRNVSNTYFCEGILSGSIAASTNATTLLSDNPYRKNALFYNDSTVIMFLKFGTGVTSADYSVKLQPDDYFEMPKPPYTGSITGRWVTATGSCKVTDIS